MNSQKLRQTKQRPKTKHQPLKSFNEWNVPKIQNTFKKETYFSRVKTNKFHQIFPCLSPHIETRRADCWYNKNLRILNLIQHFVDVYCKQEHTHTHKLWLPWLVIRLEIWLRLSRHLWNLWRDNTQVFLPMVTTHFQPAKSTNPSSWNVGSLQLWHSPICALKYIHQCYILHFKQCIK